MELLQPVTLIVKAPNQRIDDHVVNCGLEWTVKKLKEHLSSTYPNNPKENQQRLIYSGKLLQDHCTLKEVLKHSYEETQTQHTVHLLCSHTMSDVIPSEKPKRLTAASTSSYGPVPETQPAEGLRHRSISTETETQNTSNVFSEYPNTSSLPVNYAQYAGYYYPQGLAGTQGNPAMMQYQGQYAMDPMFYYQQMYAQQMAQYMQYMQQAQAAAQSSPTVTAAAANNAAAPAENAPAAGADQNNQQMVMNAAGGQAMFDDEEDFNRDWLDWSYILVRFAMLIAIVYFYSTFGRFFMVFGFFLVIYLYQSGFFRLNRRQAPQQNEAPQAEAAAEEPAEQNEPPAAGDGQEASDTAAEESTPAAPAVPPAPSVMRVCLSFFVTFFTSLIPQPPGAVNAN